MAGAHGGWSGTRDDRPAGWQDEDMGSGGLWGASGREFQVGNPTMTRAKFERAIPFALQGEEELRYLDAHPELARVPSDFQLFIIARQQKARCHFSYWLQQREDPDNIKHFKSLQELVLLLDDPEELYSKMASKDYFNPLAKAKFDSAIGFALQGEEKRRYVEQHPILQRVPPTHKLWIISKNVKNSSGVGSGKRVTFWMQVSRTTHPHARACSRVLAAHLLTPMRPRSPTCLPVHAFPPRPYRPTHPSSRTRPLTTCAHAQHLWAASRGRARCQILQRTLGIRCGHIRHRAPPDTFVIVHPLNLATWPLNPLALNL